MTYYMLNGMFCIAWSLSELLLWLVLVTVNN